MIVILHGSPMDDTLISAHDIPKFDQIIWVHIMAWVGLDVARSLGYTPVSMYAPTSKLHPTKHTLEYQFKYHDGESYHYEFTGQIDNDEGNADSLVN